MRFKRAGGWEGDFSLDLRWGLMEAGNNRNSLPALDSKQKQNENEQKELLAIIPAYI